MVKDLHNFFSQIFAFLDFSKKKRFQNSGFDARRLKKSPDRIEEAENNSTKKFIFKERKEKKRKDPELKKWDKKISIFSRLRNEEVLEKVLCDIHHKAGFKFLILFY